MELWILLGLVIAAAAVGLVTRMRRARRAADQKEAPNIYPLW
ncbi:MAG TPA: hypothetical protein VGR45_16160 [Stellaceae bacterium]|nr:hypothetical protein [Stellaceae bacterium]